jgi:hypothetical protein
MNMQKIETKIEKNCYLHSSVTVTVFTFHCPRGAGFGRHFFSAGHAYRGFELTYKANLLNELRPFVQKNETLGQKQR